MPKNKLIIGLLLFVFVSGGQTNFSWFPFRPGTHYNYKIDSSAGPISAVIKIDSIKGNSPVSYHLNKIVSSCDTCQNALLVNDPYDTTYVLSAQPQFAGHYFYKTSGNGFYFKSAHSFLLLPFNLVGFSWVFDTSAAISASIVFRGPVTIFGINDSVCIIKLSGNDTITLSKNFGIIQFPFKYTSSHSYKLVGVEGQTNQGLMLKRFHDFFDYQVGDVFQYSFSDGDFNSLPPILIEGRERWDILSASIFNDSVCYTIKTIHYDSLKLGGGPPTITAYTNTVNISFIDSLEHPANLYPAQELRADPYFLYHNGMKYIHKMVVSADNQSLTTKSFGENCPNYYLSPGTTGAAMETAFSGIYLNKNSQKIIGRRLIEGLGFTSELYNDYSRVYQRCLIGYIKNGVKTGVIWDSDPLLVKTNLLQNSTYIIYPQPADETITISGLLKKGERITLINSFGELLFAENVFSSSNFYSINTSLFASGLYFIRVTGENSDFIQKIIVSH